MIPFDSEYGLPIALALFLGSTLASVVTALTGAHVLYAGSPVRGTLFVHAAPGLSRASSAFCGVTACSSLSPSPATRPCGCSGGIFGEGTYAAIGGVDQVVPVDVYIPGCPPPPQAILNALLVTMGVREGRVGPAQLTGSNPPFTEERNLRPIDAVD